MTNVPGSGVVRGQALPGWIASIAIHLLFLSACAIGLQSCQETAGEDGAGEFRDVGLVVKSKTANSAEAEKDTATPSTTPPQENPATAEAKDRTSPTVDALLNLPEAVSPQILGPGARTPSSPLANPSQLLPGTAVKRIQPLAGLKKGETQFLGIRDQGTRFVYVLDRSGSMDQEHALEVAKAELVTSLQHLDETQQFQVIFYNVQHRLLTLGGRETLHRATDINKTLARQQIARVTPDGGTFHYPALAKALSFEPEVIYFLTDADANSAIHPGDMERLLRRNRGRTRIHTIKFGLGAELTTNHYVKKLALQNGGRYRYRDIKTFSSLPRLR
ncbi:MAG: hypothetical protein CMJ68_16275 [Planctomycetaceae bacterium]|nr:hypothetical protein [Planctomycetaceae bacterium]|tara:strand:+ start:2542 stop:3537 length:996 start_codon:yes stop_codon:yes gene_type:complete